ncbi:ankyrin [Cucurbitaria berberidis CBS 394.84]|uniref:Ankyrin n=1 Tax=Cucurbitaria berberidis CBS 394.84 TaxID=1168544 RepID=A0A9P4G9H0_9PLEO|nr:ankyrin [Cucurbitaria berberidis CBS 394.84]KAF1841331.1 ankyrin [Cucurbitaria berberidis CBS 394.84]
MDPVSFAASLVTLLGVAGKTSEFVYNFILDIRDVPKEIRSQAIKLQCLHQTLTALWSLYGTSSMTPELQLDPVLEDHIRIFLSEIQTLENKIRERSTKLSGSRRQHMKERLIWLSSDRELRKFYTSLDNWSQIFSTAVSTTNLKLLMKINEQVLQTRSTPSIVHPQQRQLENMLNTGGKCLDPQVGTHHLGGTTPFTLQRVAPLPSALRACLKRTRDPVGLRVQQWYTYTSKVFLVNCLVGPSVLRCWSEEGKSVYKTMSLKNSACLASTLHIRRFFPRRISLMIAYLLEGPKVSFTWSLAINGLLRPIHPAYLACKNGDWHMLRKMLEDKRVNIFDTTAYGTSLLHIAAQSGHDEIVTGLLHQGAKVDAENDFGETPLQVAIWKPRNYAIASSLLTFGADLNHQDITGRTALHSYFNDSVRALIEFHQEDLDNTTQDSSGMSIGHYVAWSKSSSVIDLRRCYRANPASLGTTNDEGMTILHYACQRGNLEIIEFLLGENNPAFSQADWHGRTLLHYATESSRSAQTIDILVQEGFDVHAVDHRGRTVLHHAASAGSVAAVEKLLELGVDADLHVLDADARTPLQLAACCGRDAVMDVLNRRCGVLQVPELAEERDASDTDGQKAWAMNTKVFINLIWTLLDLKYVGGCILLWLIFQMWALVERRWRPMYSVNV